MCIELTLKVIIVFTADKLFVVCEYTGTTLSIGEAGTEGIKASTELILHAILIIIHAMP